MPRFDPHSPCPRKFCGGEGARRLPRYVPARAPDACAVAPMKVVPATLQPAQPLDGCLFDRITPTCRAVGAGLTVPILARLLVRSK
jgi:hypothetical protein